MEFLIGTLTRFGGAGVTKVALEDDRLRPLWTRHGLTDPNWLTASPTVKNRVYLVSSDAVGEMTGCIRQASLSPDCLSMERCVPSGGNAPCHIAVSGDERFLVAANYNTGSIAVFRIGADGLGERIQLIEWKGRGVDPQRQTSPHAHQVTYLPQLPGYLCATDLGTDQAYVYRQNPETGLLNERYRVRFPDGEGPRHFVHTPEASYLLTEMGGKVFTVRFGEDGAEVSGGVSALPEGYVGKNTGAAIRLSRDGRALYASNRGHDSIAVFAMERKNADAPLMPVEPPEWIPTEGGLPRDFIVLPDGALLTACQSYGLTLLRNGKCVDRLPLMGAVCVMVI